MFGPQLVALSWNFKRLSVATGGRLLKGWDLRVMSGLYFQHRLPALSSAKM